VRRATWAHLGQGSYLLALKCRVQSAELSGPRAARFELSVPKVAKSLPGELRD